MPTARLPPPRALTALIWPTRSTLALTGKCRTLYPFFLSSLTRPQATTQRVTETPAPTAPAPRLAARLPADLTAQGRRLAATDLLATPTIPPPTQEAASPVTRQGLRAPAVSDLLGSDPATQLRATALPPLAQAALVPALLATAPPTLVPTIPTSPTRPIQESTQTVAA